MQLVFSLGGLIVWYVGGRDVIGHEMTLGQLMAFLAYLAMFYAPLSALSNFTTWLTSFLSGSKRVLELLDMPLTIPDAANPTPWTNPKGAIRFDQVSFGYDPNQPVLKDISFDVRPGEMVGIVGRSGSGSHVELLQSDGVYAKLVRIQTQVSKDPNVDRLMHRLHDTDTKNLLENRLTADLRRESEAAQATTIDNVDSDSIPAAIPNGLRWLQSSSVVFRVSDHQQLQCWSDSECLGKSVFAVRAFPASYPDEFISVRGIDADVEEVELGMIRDLRVWSQEDRERILISLDRRYLLREIMHLYSISLKFGYLDFDVETTNGRAQFSLRWTQSQATEFGESGKLLIDTEENRYLVRDVSKMTAAQQELFLQYIYW